MPKLVEGELAHLQMTSYLSRSSHSFASTTLRGLVSDMAETTHLYPDVVPREVQVTPVIEDNAGRLVNELG